MPSEEDGGHRGCPPYRKRQPHRCPPTDQALGTPDDPGEGMRVPTLQEKHYNKSMTSTGNGMIHTRKSPRLKGFDYSQPGGYHVTICSHQRTPIFGEIQHIDDLNTMVLSWIGKIIDQEIIKLNSYLPQLSIEKYAILPNHVHLLISLDPSLLKGKTISAKSLSQIVRLFKARSSREVHKISPGLVVWQNSFYDHVIRDQTDFDKVWQYIDNNVAQGSKRIYP